MNAKIYERDTGGPLIVSPCGRAPDPGPWFPPRDARDVKGLQALGVKVSVADIDPNAWTAFELDMVVEDGGRQ